MNINKNLQQGLTIGYFAKVKKKKTGSGMAGGLSGTSGFQANVSLHQHSNLLSLATREVDSNLSGTELNAIKAATSQGNNQIDTIPATLVTIFGQLFAESVSNKYEILGIIRSNGKLELNNGEVNQGGGFFDVEWLEDWHNGSPVSAIHTHPFYNDPGIPSTADIAGSTAVVPSSPAGNPAPYSWTEMLVGSKYIVMYDNGGVTGVYDKSTGQKIGKDIYFRYSMDRPINSQEELNQWFKDINNYAIERLDGTIDEFGQTDEERNTGQISGTGQGSGQREKDDEKEDIVLMDEHRNIYPLKNVSIMTNDNSLKTGNIRFPALFEVDTDGKILKQGAKVVIVFPIDRQNPVVIGALVPLGNQSIMDDNLKYNTDELDTERDVRKGDGWGIEQEIGKSGYRITLTGISYGMTVSGMGTMKHAAYNYISEAENTNYSFGKNIEIGGINKRLSEEETLKDLKSEKVSILGKMVVIGHSDEQIGVIPIDEEGEVENPQLQPIAMGITLLELLDRLINKLYAAKFIGGGAVVKLSAPDQIAIEQEVRTFLPNILSEVGLVLYKADTLPEEE